MERMIARCFREAGARVRERVYVRDLNVPNVDSNDNRHIEVIAEGLPLYHGRQIVIDATLVSPLTANGQPRTVYVDGTALHTDRVDGAALQNAEKTKRMVYADVAASRRCH